MNNLDFASVLAAFLFFFASGASAMVYPIGISINGNSGSREDVQLPNSSQSVYGVRVGLARAGHDEMAGLAFAVGHNDDDFAGGFQISALGKNSAESADWGLWQIAPFGNKLDRAGGVVQFSLVNEIDGDAEGFQLGLFNKASGTFYGVQMGLLNVIGGSSSKFRGLQIGLINYMECPPTPVACSQIQIGVANVTSGHDWRVGFLPGLRVVF